MEDQNQVQSAPLPAKPRGRPPKSTLGVVDKVRDFFSSKSEDEVSSAEGGPARVDNSVSSTPVVDNQPETPKVEEKPLPPGHFAAPAEFISIVRDICGEGFEVYTKEHAPGVSFKLTIIPPDHLKESSEDRRVKVIPYMQGSAGVRLYAEKVRDFCINWAFKRGVVYDRMGRIPSNK